MTDTRTFWKSTQKQFLRRHNANVDKFTDQAFYSLDVSMFYQWKTNN